MYLVTALGITVGYHRMLTHRAFQTYKPVEYAFAAAGSMAVQGPVIDWVADHRKHHAHTDEEGDPHSPHVGHGSGLAGLWHAHVGWLFDANGQADRRKYAARPDGRPRACGCSTAASSARRSLSLAIPFALGWLLTGTLARRPRPGCSGAGSCGSSSSTTSPGRSTRSATSTARRRFATDDQSTNVWWLALALARRGLAPQPPRLPPLGRPRPAPLGARPVGRRSSARCSALGLAWNVVRIAPERQRTATRHVLGAATPESTWRAADAARMACLAECSRVRACAACDSPHILTRGHLDPHRLAGELPDQRRARLRRDRVQGAAAQPGARVRARRRDRLLRHRGAGVRRRSPGCARRCSRTATPIWPQGKKKHPEDYPWRVEAEPVVVLDEAEFVPAESLLGELEHVAQVAGRALAPRVPGPAADDLRRRREAARASGSRPPRGRRRGRGDPRAPLHGRGGERAPAAARADAAPAARGARPADRRRGARGCSPSAAPTNGGGEPGREVGEAFLEVRGAARRAPGAGIVVRDIDRGLIDFPAILDGREVYLCWELDEDGVAFWHDLESGYGGRQPLD